MTTSQKNAQKISFIIVQYRSADMIERSIRSIKSVASGYVYDIVVVHNEPVTQRHIDGVRQIYNKNNDGYARACNQGAMHATGDLLCFFNPDAVFSTASLCPIMRHFAAPDTGIVGPRLVTARGVVQPWSVGHEQTPREIAFNNIGLGRSKRLWLKKKTCTVDWVSGASLFIRRDLFENLNGFDEDFFLYYEDVDLCRRARKEQNVAVLYEPQCVVEHYGGKSSREKKDQKKHYYTSQQHYIQKHFGSLHAKTLHFLRILSHPQRS